MPLFVYSLISLLAFWSLFLVCIWALVLMPDAVPDLDENGYVALNIVRCLFSPITRRSQSSVLAEGLAARV